MIKVAPSILASDLLNVGSDVQRMIDAGCDLLHLDIMDAHFVPNLSFSPAMCEALHHRFPNLKLDVHLMMDNPGDYIRCFAEAGAWNITIHAEIPGDADALLDRIHELGVRAGLSVKPGTPVETIRPSLNKADMVLVMTVEPGFGGQRFQPEMAEKLSSLRGMGYSGLLEADGGVKLSNLPMLSAVGLDVAVIGTALFNAEDAADYIRQVHAI